MRGEVAGPRVFESAHARGVVCLHQCGCEVPEGASTGGQMGGGRQSPGAQTPHFTEEAQEEDTLARSQSPRVGLLRKPDHETVSSVLCQEQSVEASGSRSGFKTWRMAPQLRETPPHPSLAFREAVTVGFVGALGTVCCGADVLSHSLRVRLSATPQTVARQAPLSTGFFKARILEWVAVSFSGGSSWTQGLNL